MELISLLNTINTPLEAEGVPTYIVGGFIRDSILKLPPKDLDLVIQGDKESILPVILRSTNIKSVFDDSKNKITKLTLDTSLEDTTIQDIDIQFTRVRTDCRLGFNDTFWFWTRWHLCQHLTDGGEIVPGDV